MDFIAVRLKRHPDCYVGKQNVSYAFKSDQEIQERQKTIPQHNIDWHLQPNAHWFKGEKNAQVWTDKKALKKLLTYCSSKYRDYGPVTWSEYEMIYNGVVMPLDKLSSMP